MAKLFIGLLVFVSFSAFAQETGKSCDLVVKVSDLMNKDRVKKIIKKEAEAKGHKIVQFIEYDPHVINQGTDVTNTIKLKIDCYTVDFSRICYGSIDSNLKTAKGEDYFKAVTLYKGPNHFPMWLVRYKNLAKELMLDLPSCQ